MTTTITRHIGNGTVAVWHDGTEYDRFSYGYRQRYGYVITANGWEYVGNDIRSGVSAPVDENDAMASLLSFMSACAESRSYGDGDGENANLFPDHVGSWLVENEDDIAVASMEFADYV